VTFRDGSCIQLISRLWRARDLHTACVVRWLDHLDARCSRPLPEGYIHAYKTYTHVHRLAALLLACEKSLLSCWRYSNSCEFFASGQNVIMLQIIVWFPWSFCIPAWVLAFCQVSKREYVKIRVLPSSVLMYPVTVLTSYQNKSLHSF